MPIPVVTFDMSTDAVNEILKAFNDLDVHKRLHEIDNKFVPRGSQEFREALFECRHEEEMSPQPRERSNTIDTTYRKPHPSVHFASNLVTVCAKKNKSKDDIHTHLHPDGILRHGRERSNTYDGTVQRPRKTVHVRSPLCNENETNSNNADSAVGKLLENSPEARKIDSEVLTMETTKRNQSKQTVKETKSLSPVRHTRNGYKTSPGGSPHSLRKSGTASPLDRSSKGSAVKK